MGLYNFQKRFVPMIESGRKKHTIRARRKHRDKPGDICHLYTGLRTKAARLIKRSPCVKVEEIEIVGDEANPTVIIEGDELNRDERERLAYCDGFDSFKDMAEFWKGRIPFLGDITHWQ